MELINQRKTGSQPQEKLKKQKYEKQTEPIMRTFGSLCLSCTAEMRKCCGFYTYGSDRIEMNRNEAK